MSEKKPNNLGLNILSKVTDAVTKIVPATAAFLSTTEGPIPDPADKLAAGVSAALANQAGNLATEPFEKAAKKIKENQVTPTHFDEKLISLLSNEQFIYLTRLLLRMAPALVIVAFQQPESVHLLQAISESVQGLSVDDYGPILRDLITPLNAVATTAVCLSSTVQLSAHTVNARDPIRKFISLTK